MLSLQGGKFHKVPKYSFSSLGRGQMADSVYIHTRNGQAPIGDWSLSSNSESPQGSGPLSRQLILYSNGSWANHTLAMFPRSADRTDDARLRKEMRLLSAAVWESPITPALNSWQSR